MSEDKIKAWRCACGKQMLNGEIPNNTKDSNGRSLQICQAYPDCGNQPMSKDEWNRYRHLAAVAGEEAAQKWKEKDLPILQKKKEEFAKFLEKRISTRENTSKEI